MGYTFAEAGWADGFYEALGEAGLGHLLGRDFGERGGEGHDGDAGEGGDFAEGDGYRIAVPLGHLQVENDEMRAEFGGFG